MHRLVTGLLRSNDLYDKLILDHMYSDEKSGYGAGWYSSSNVPHICHKLFMDPTGQLSTIQGVVPPKTTMGTRAS